MASSIDTKYGLLVVEIDTPMVSSLGDFLVAALVLLAVPSPVCPHALSPIRAPKAARAAMDLTTVFLLSDFIVASHFLSL
jgi:hypothetical protein